MKFGVLLVRFCFFTLLLGINKASSSIPKTSTYVPKVKSFIAEGSFRGGLSGDGFSILAIKRVYSTSGNSERFIFEVGDRAGAALKGKLGYYHAQLFKNPSELSLDFSQMHRSKVSSTQLKKLIKTSKIVETAQMVLDKQDGSTNVQMRFKYPVKMRVFSLAPKKQTPKLIVDIVRL